jgi:hypothetical protein
MTSIRTGIRHDHLATHPGLSRPQSKIRLEKKGSSRKGRRMSLRTEILDRLSGISAVREHLNMTSKRVEKLADLLIDHERRLIRIEAGSPPPKQAHRLKK